MQPVFLKKDEKQEADLENLLENYIKKSEELEIRESKILRQVELIQAAVISLQAWRDSRKPSTTFSDLVVPIDLKQVEEETKQIREETQRIQEEIRQKIIENKLLEEKVERKKSLESEEDVRSILQKITHNQKPKTDEIQSRYLEPTPFKKKLLELEEMERKLKKELSTESEEFRKKSQNQSNKIALLEWESIYHRDFIENLKKQKNI